MSRRWIAWHLLSATLVSAMIALGVWQWMVSTSPATPGGPPAWNLRNLVYALQWWVFASFGVWFWFRYIRDQRDAELAEEQEDAAVARAAGSANAGNAASSADAADVAGSAKAAKAASGAAALSPQVISLDAPAAERLARSQASPPSPGPLSGGLPDVEASTER